MIISIYSLPNSDRDTGFHRAGADSRQLLGCHPYDDTSWRHQLCHRDCWRGNSYVYIESADSNCMQDPFYDHILRIRSEISILIRHSIDHQPASGGHLHKHPSRIHINDYNDYPSISARGHDDCRRDVRERCYCHANRQVDFLPSILDNTNNCLVTSSLSGATQTSTRTVTVTASYFTSGTATSTVTGQSLSTSKHPRTLY